MRNFSNVLAATCLASSLLAATASAVAAEPQPVTDLPTQTVRTDVRAVCPGIDAALQAELAPTFRHIPRGGSMTVSFQLTGSDVADVHVRSEPWSWSYGRAIRTAVRGLNCATVSGQPQHLAFVLSVTDDETPDTPRFALLP